VSVTGPSQVDIDFTIDANGDSESNAWSCLLVPNDWRFHWSTWPIDSVSSRRNVVGPVWEASVCDQRPRQIDGSGDVSPRERNGIARHDQSLSRVHAPQSDQASFQPGSKG